MATKCRKCGKPVNPNDDTVEAVYLEQVEYQHRDICTAEEAEAARKADAEESLAEQSRRDEDFLDPSDK
jgi:hypothetical protein